MPRASTPSTARETRLARHATSDRDNPEKLVDLLDKLVEKTDGEQVSLDAILDAVSNRAFGPLLLVPALIAVAPTGAIPGMSILTGTTILLIAAQMLVSKDKPWLPQRLLDFSFSRDRLVKSVDAAKPYAAKIDNVIKPRLTALAEFPFNSLLAIVCAILALTMFPLALLPFAVAIPGTAVILFAIGLTVKDGYVILAGYALAIAATGVVAYAFL